VAKFDLTLALQEAGERLWAEWSMRRRCMSGRRWSATWGTSGKLLEGMVADELQAVDRIPILSVEERHHFCMSGTIRKRSIRG